MSAPEAWVECPTCGGSGTLTHPGASEREWLEGLREEPCPADCVDGLVPSDGEIEAAAHGFVANLVGLSEGMRAALVAARRYQRKAEQ